MSLSQLIPSFYFPLSLSSFTPLNNFFGVTGPWLSASKGLELTAYMLLQWLCNKWFIRKQITENRLNWETDDKPHDYGLTKISNHYHRWSLLYKIVITYRILTFYYPSSWLASSPPLIIVSGIKKILVFLPSRIQWFIQLFFGLISMQLSPNERMLSCSLSDLWNMSPSSIKNFGSTLSSLFLYPSPLNLLFVSILHYLFKILNLNCSQRSFFLILQWLNASIMKFNSVQGVIINPQPNSSIQMNIWGFLAVRDKFLSMTNLPSYQTLPGFISGWIFELSTASMREGLFSKIKMPYSHEGFLKSANWYLLKVSTLNSNAAFLHSWIESLCNSFWIWNLIQNFRPGFLTSVRKASARYRELEKVIYNRILASFNIDVQAVKKQPQLSVQLEDRISEIKENLNVLVDSKIMLIMKLLTSLQDFSFTINIFFASLLSFSVRPLNGLFWKLKDHLTMPIWRDLFSFMLNLLFTLSLIMKNINLLHMNNYLQI